MQEKFVFFFLNNKRPPNSGAFLTDKQVLLPYLTLSNKGYASAMFVQA